MIPVVLDPFARRGTLVSHVALSNNMILLMFGFICTRQRLHIRGVVANLYRGLRGHVPRHLANYHSLSSAFLSGFGRTCAGRFPFLFEVALLNVGSCPANMWRLDVSLLRDSSATDFVMSEVSNSICTVTDLVGSWDSLKYQWRLVLVDVRKQRKVSHARQRNGSREHIKIAQRGEAATLLMPGYLESVRAIPMGR